MDGNFQIIKKPHKIRVKIRPLMDGNLEYLPLPPLLLFVKIRPLMDGNDELLEHQLERAVVKIRPLMDGNWTCVRAPRSINSS